MGFLSINFPKRSLLSLLNPVWTDAARRAVLEIGAYNHRFHADLRVVPLRGPACRAGSDGSMWWSASSSARISHEFTEFSATQGVEWPAIQVCRAECNKAR